MTKSELLDKFYKLSNEDYLNVSKVENQKQLERLDEIEQDLIDLGVDTSEIFMEFRAELYYEIYMSKKL